MKMRLLSLLLAPLLATACAHKTVEPIDNTPVIGKMSKADVTFVQRDPDSKHGCKADSECPTGDYCHPDQLVCFQSYPHPRMLDISFTPEKACQIVNVYFPYDSVELVPEAQKWLEYNIRCIKSRGAKKMHLDAYCDARGSQEYNLKLSQRRGEYVKQLLVQKGLDIDLLVESEGEHHPMKKGSTEEAYAFNRRVEFRIVE